MVTKKKHVQINRLVRGLECGEGGEENININLKMAAKMQKKLSYFHHLTP